MSAPVSTSPRSRGSAALGARVRELREARGFSLRQLSDECQGRPSRTQLHEVERGNRPLGGVLLTRLASALQVDPDELLQLGGTVSEDLVRDLLSGPLARTVQRGRLVPRAYTAMRRVHLERVAYMMRPPRFPPVKVEEDGGLLDALQLDRRPADAEPWARFETPTNIEYGPALDADEAAPERRFVLAHMAAHVLLSRETGERPHCEQAVDEPGEAEATYLAALLLVPERSLRDEVESHMGRYDLRTPAGLAGLFGEVAGRFGVPTWLAAQRVADAGLLPYAARVGRVA